MATPSNDELQAQVSAHELKIGNVVRASTGSGLTVGSNLVLTTDSSGNLTALAPLTAVQPTVASEVATLTGKSTAGILTTTLVAGGDVTTATKAAFLRVALTDSNGNITNGNYYLELFTLT